ncbi:cation:proton antiporter [Methylomarinovum tepidoasis]|nr:cation:proton antiporter [Methylomarinovum sp. IN45]
MIETVLALAAMLYLALQIEDKLAIPVPLSLIALAFLLNHLFPEITRFTPDPQWFAALVLTLLPILLISDALELSVAELKRHAWSLFYLAVVAVVLSVVAGLWLRDFLFGEYHLGVAATVLLFAMVLATDPVSVVSVFSRFEIPHRLKILAEGESLFNDATALIVFVYIGLHLLQGGKLTLGYVTEISLVVGLGSVALGLVFGLIGLGLLKTTENRIAEMMVLLMTGYAAFDLAEHFYTLLNLLGGHSHLHLSGILACIVATVTVHHWMSREEREEERQIEAQQALIERPGATRGLIDTALNALRVTLEERVRHLRNKEDIQLLGLVSNTILFVAMAELIELELLARYWHEILVMFVATTVIRALMMAKFAWLTRQTRRMTDVNLRWWGVLTFAGIKGGLSIVMLSMIPREFPFLDLFKAVVIGVVLLSTFLYSLILLALISRNAAVFRQELAAERRDSM